MRSIRLLVLLILGAALCIFLAGLGLYLRDSSRRVAVASATKISDIYATNVATFFLLSNALPSTPQEINDYVFGTHGGHTDLEYTTVDIPARRFRIRQGLVHHIRSRLGEGNR